MASDHITQSETFVQLSEADMEAAISAMHAGGIGLRHIRTVRQMRLWLHRFEQASLGGTGETTEEWRP